MLRPATLILIAAAMAAIAAAAPARADFAAGAEAYDAGDFARALAQWSAEAKAGNRDAQFNVAEMYRQGQGAAPDMKRAFAWYLRAAGQGVIVAQRNVGVMYARGIGTAPDEIEGFKWLSIAAAQNEHSAMRALDSFKRRLIQKHGEAKARKKIGEARFRAATWQPKPEPRPEPGKEKASN